MRPIDKSMIGHRVLCNNTTNDKSAFEFDVIDVRIDEDGTPYVKMNDESWNSVKHIHVIDVLTTSYKKLPRESNKPGGLRRFITYLKDNVTFT